MGVVLHLKTRIGLVMKLLRPNPLLETLPVYGH